MPHKICFFTPHFTLLSRPREEDPIARKGATLPVLILVLQPQASSSAAQRKGKQERDKRNSGEATALMQKKAVGIGEVKQNYRLQMILLMDQTSSNTEIKILCK